MIWSLDPLQKAVWQGGRHMPLNGTVIWCLEGRLSSEQVRKALNVIKDIMPFVSLRIADHPGSGLRLTTSEVSEFDIREECSTAHWTWTEAAADELRRPFILDRGPLLRVRLVHSPCCTYLLATGHHAFYDGLSLNFLLRVLLTAVEREGEDIPSLPFISNLADHLPPKVQRSIRMRLLLALAILLSPGIGFLLRVANQFGTINPLAGDQTSSIPVKKFVVLGGNLDESATAYLFSRCKAEGVTVYAAVCAAFLRAAAELTTTIRSSRISFSSPVNLRQKLPSFLNEGMGILLSRIIIKIKHLSNFDFWSLCQEIKGNVKCKLESELLYAPVLMLPALINSVPESCMPMLVGHFLGGKVKQILDISNLGPIAIPPASKQFSVSAVYAAGNVFLGARTLTSQTVGKRLFFALTFREGSFDRILGKKLMDRGLQALRNC